MVVTNLDHAVDRHEAFGTRNAHLGPVRRCAAVYGATVDRRELQRRGVDAELRFYPCSPQRLGGLDPPTPAASVLRKAPRRANHALRPFGAIRADALNRTG